MDAGARRDGIAGRPAAELVGRKDLPARADARVDVHRGRAFLHVDSGKPRRPSRIASAGGSHREDDLTVKEDLRIREDGISAEGGAALVGPRDVGSEQHRDHPRRAAHGIEVHRAQASAGCLRVPRGDVQGAGGLADVVDVGGAAADMALGAVVGDGGAHVGVRFRRPAGPSPRSGPLLRRQHAQARSAPAPTTRVSERGVPPASSNALASSALATLER